MQCRLNLVMFCENHLLSILEIYFAFHKRSSFHSHCFIFLMYAFQLRTIVFQPFCSCFPALSSCFPILVVCFPAQCNFVSNSLWLLSDPCCISPSSVRLLSSSLWLLSNPCRILPSSVWLFYNTWCNSRSLVAFLLHCHMPLHIKKVRNCML